MYEGRIVGIVPGHTSRDVLGLMMAGLSVEEAREQAASHATIMGAADQASDNPIGGAL